MTPYFVQDATTTFQSDWIQQHDVDAQNILKMPVSTILSSYAFCAHSTWLGPIAYLSAAVQTALLLNINQATALSVLMKA